MNAAPLRPAATVLLIRDGESGLEVLMVVRRDDRSQYAAAMVFPGGAVDAEDADPDWLALCDGADGLDPEERARRIAGFRELHEETGMLLLEHPQRAPTPIGGGGFRAQVQGSGGRLDLGAMIPFAHWVTPEGAPKRFDTHFRLCWLTTELTAVSDGGETVAAEWLTPSRALELGASGERNLLFPTKCQLELLAQSPTVADAVAAARARRIVPVSPRMERREQGTFLSIPPEAGYPVCEFQMGR